jgi:hypothetical protein
MELLWVVLTLFAVDLAALLFAVDTRPGLEHTPSWRHRRSLNSRAWRSP